MVYNTGQGLILTGNRKASLTKLQMSLIVVGTTWTVVGLQYNYICTVLIGAENKQQKYIYSVNIYSNRHQYVHFLTRLVIL
jgi:hypothetical protein